MEQLDSRVYTGNTVSDAVMGSKFRYAAKKIKGIRPDAEAYITIRTFRAKNIKCAVKYGGDMDCIVKGNRFTLSVMVNS